MTAKDVITSRMRQIHKERVIKNLHRRFDESINHRQSSLTLNFKPDFTAMLTKKFDSYDVKQEDKSREDCPFDPSEESSQGDDEDKEYEGEKKQAILERGKRNQQATSLRVSQIERALANCKDLTKD